MGRRLKTFPENNPKMKPHCCPLLSSSIVLLQFLYGGWLYTFTVANHGRCRRLEFLQQKDGYALVGHVFKSHFLGVGIQIYSNCRNRCTMENRCKLINIAPEGSDKFLCQLSESDHAKHPQDLVETKGRIYV